jgi:hypothetical protein
MITFIIVIITINSLNFGNITSLDLDMIDTKKVIIKNFL